MIEIRSLSQDRWQDYKNLRLEALQSDPLAFRSSYEEEITLSKEVFQRRIGSTLFAILNDRPIGMIGYYFEDNLQTKHIANIVAMYVTKEHRNQGIGSQLIDCVILLIKQNKDILKIKISVNPEQESATRLYNKYGFIGIGKYQNETLVNGNYYDELLMEKYI